MCDRQDYFKKNTWYPHLKLGWSTLFISWLLGPWVLGKMETLWNIPFSHASSEARGRRAYIHLSWVFQVYSCCISIESSNLGHPQRRLGGKCQTPLVMFHHPWKTKRYCNMLWRSKGLQYILFGNTQSMYLFGNPMPGCLAKKMCERKMLLTLSFFLDGLRGAMSQFLYWCSSSTVTVDD